MKKYLYLIVTFLLCSCVTDGWGVNEKTIINSEGKTLRVLTTDNNSDYNILRKHSANLSPAELTAPLFSLLAEKMINTVTSPEQNGVGIAAPQVGILRRLIAVQRFDKQGKPFELYPNISITEKRGELQYFAEGCLSVPNQKCNVQRYNDVTIKYTSLHTFKDTTEIIRGLTAVIFQHECDHLDGILYTDRIWENSSSWYKTDTINNNYIDVFYIASTNIISSIDKDGKELFRAVLSDDEKNNLGLEYKYVNENIFCDSVNFFAPYYHQYTLNAIKRPKEDYDSIVTDVKKEIRECFNYYINHYNQGRKYILAGFSQGADCVKSLLMSMDSTAYSNLVASYVIGFGVNDEELKCNYIKKATSSSDKGVCISFNSVVDTSVIYPLVYHDSKICINPINWRTDDTPAEFEFEGEKYIAKIDTNKKVILVPDFADTTDIGFEAPWPKGNLHHYDILFYAKSLKDNYKERAYR